MSILKDHTLLKQVFDLYGVTSDDTEASYFTEYKKAFYKHVFDSTWFTEINEIENEHFSSIPLILWTSVESSEGFTENPLDKKHPA